MSNQKPIPGTNGNQHRKHGNIDHIPGFGCGLCGYSCHNGFLLTNWLILSEVYHCRLRIVNHFYFQVDNYLFLPSP